MDDIEEIECNIKQGKTCITFNKAQTSYLRAIAKTQLLILKELRKRK